MKKLIILLGLVSFLMSSSASVFAEDVAAPDPAAGAAAPETAEEVPPPPPPTLAVSGVCAEPDRMMYNDLIAKIDVKRQQWRERYESVKTEDDIAA